MEEFDDSRFDYLTASERMGMFKMVDQAAKRRQELTDAGNFEKLIKAMDSLNGPQQTEGSTPGYLTTDESDTLMTNIHKVRDEREKSRKQRQNEETTPEPLDPGGE